MILSKKLEAAEIPKKYWYILVKQKKRRTAEIPEKKSPKSKSPGRTLSKGSKKTTKSN